MNGFTRQDELERFKKLIDIRDVMATYGLTADRPKSSRAYTVMRHMNGEKLIVTRKANRHWIYANAHDNRDRGTVIDFLGNRGAGSLGDIRKELRPWLSGGLTLRESQPSLPELIPTTHDTARVIDSWERAKPVPDRHRYLEEARGIPAVIIADPIFAGRLRSDRRGNALMAHFNANGLCGFELKNVDFTGFSPGGSKGLGCSRPRPDDQELIICETWIDLLSLAALEGTDGRRFLSVAGQISPAQEKLLASAAKKMPPRSTIILGLDNDAGGHKLADQITEVLSGHNIRRHLPPNTGEDWNDVLRRTQSLGSASPTPA